MRYTLLLHYPEMTAEELGEDALEEGMTAFDPYAKALGDAGVLLLAEVLATAQAQVRLTTRPRTRGGRTQSLPLQEAGSPDRRG